MNLLLAGALSSLTTVVIAVGAWFGARKLRRAQVGKLDAETRQTNALSAKTEAESWQMLNGGLSARVAALEQENETLRDRLAAAEARAEQAEREAIACRQDLNTLLQRPTPGATL